MQSNLRAAFGIHEERMGVAGIPTLRGMEHVGFTVPDLEEASRFLIDIIGCTFVYELPLIADPGGSWMRDHLEVHPDATCRVRFFRCGHGSNFEVFEYSTPYQCRVPPLNSDVGGHHLAFYVDDFAAALAWLRANEVAILGEPTVRDTGASAGQTWIYFKSPWGMQFELVSFPEGKGYEQHTDVRLWHPADPSA